MDHDLDVRYQVLFATYGMGEGQLLWHSKLRIAELMRGNPPLLRSDAAHFLLVNFDHMIIRPLTGIILGESLAPVVTLREPRMHSADAFTVVDRSLNLILDVLAKRGERPLSAHAVLLTVHELWAELGRQLNWS